MSVERVQGGAIPIDDDVAVFVNVNGPHRCEICYIRFRRISPEELQDPRGQRVCIDAGRGRKLRGGNPFQFKQVGFPKILIITVQKSKREKDDNDCSPKHSLEIDWLAAIISRLRLGPPKTKLAVVSGRRMCPIRSPACV